MDKQETKLSDKKIKILDKDTSKKVVKNKTSSSKKKIMIFNKYFVYHRVNSRLVGKKHGWL